MKAVVLAAGEGTRMEPLTADRSKPMLPVAGRPLIDHVLGRLAAASVEEVVVVVGERAADLRNHVGDATPDGLPVTYVEQDEPRGTGDALLRAADRLDDDFLLLNGDVLVEPADIERIAGAEGRAMLVADVEDVSDFGRVRVDGSRVAGIDEKPDDDGPGRVNAGIYRLDPGIFPTLEDLEPSERGEVELTDALVAGPAPEAVPAKRWLDVGRPWDLLNANEWLMEDLETDLAGTVEEGAHLEGPVVVEEGARVRSGAYLEGPVLVQRGADVGPNCYVRGATVVGPDVRVGNACEVKNSLLMRGTHAAHLSYIGDSVLGEEVNLGAGTITANLRLDERSVPIITDEGRVDSGRRKLGAILGDRVKTGINASLDVGTIVGEESFIGPGTLVRGSYGPRSRIH